MSEPFLQGEAWSWELGERGTPICRRWDLAMFPALDGGGKCGRRVLGESQRDFVLQPGVGPPVGRPTLGRRPQRRWRWGGCNAVGDGGRREFPSVATRRDRQILTNRGLKPTATLLRSLRDLSGEEGEGRREKGSGYFWCSSQSRRRPSRVRLGRTAVISGTPLAMSWA